MKNRRDNKRKETTGYPTINTEAENGVLAGP